MKYKNFLSLSFILIAFVPYAQNKYGIRKAEAFFIEHQPGNIRANDEGDTGQHGPDTIRTIYVETKDNSIKWIMAWYNNKPFSITAIPLNELPYEVGVNKHNNKKIVLQPAGKNKIWLLQLEKNSSSLKPPVKMKAGEIILQGRSGKKTLIHRISFQTELEAMPSV